MKDLLTLVAQVHILWFYYRVTQNITRCIRSMHHADMAEEQLTTLMGESSRVSGEVKLSFKRHMEHRMVSSSEYKPETARNSLQSSRLSVA